MRSHADVTRAYPYTGEIFEYGSLGFKVKNHIVIYFTGERKGVFLMGKLENEDGIQYSVFDRVENIDESHFRKIPRADTFVLKLRNE